MKNKKIKITFEVTEELGFFIDDESLLKEYGGDVLKMIKFLYQEEGMGMISNEVKLVKVELV